MTESEKVRCLIRGLRPEMMERVAISNPKTATDFLQHLQRLTHVGTMAQHAMAAMPRHALPGFVAASPFAPGTDTSPGLGMTAASHNRRGNSEKHANTGNPGTSDQSQMLAVLQESIKALTIAMERIAPHPARGYPSNPSRNARGQVICFRCHQEGHIRRQCQEPLQETGEYLPQQGAGKLGKRGSGVSPRTNESHSAAAVSAHYLPTVRHRPGRKNSNADLSRLPRDAALHSEEEMPLLVVTEGRQRVIDLQREDPFLKPIIDHLQNPEDMAPRKVRRAARAFRLKEDVLFRRRHEREQCLRPSLTIPDCVSRPDRRTYSMYTYGNSGLTPQ
ncbi:hypothetical protein MTO96_040133 [Rhipicephalus appendiculatus]